MKTRESVLFGRLLANALIERGGFGSGHHGHAGREGEVGGSKPGGVLVGRIDADDADEQFKFSGQARLARPKGPHVDISLRRTTGKGRLEIHGAKDKGGKTQKGVAVVRVGDANVQLDHDELHDLRSKMRFVHEANTRGATSVGRDEKKIARGNSIEVKVGGKTVTVPVNDVSIRAIDDAVRATKTKGYHLAAERPSEVASAVKRMSNENPVRVAKALGFSKAGTYASMKAHAERFTDRGMRRMATQRAAGRGKGSKAYFEKAVKNAIAARSEARGAEARMSATQAAKAYKRAAVWTTILSRRK